jgi:cytochrome P450
MTDELDYDDLEEMHAALRDHLSASDVVSLAESDQAIACEAIANLFAVFRTTAEALGATALALRRQPTLAERLAQGLDGLPRSSRGLSATSLGGAE